MNGIDDVLAVGQPLTEERTIVSNGNLLKLDGPLEISGPLHAMNGIKTSMEIWFLGYAEEGSATPTHRIVISIGDQYYYIPVQPFTPEE